MQSHQPETGVVAALGEVILDIVAHSLEAPALGQVLGEIRNELGGCAANVCVAAARQGAEARFIGHWGNDPASRSLAKVLQSQGVEMLGLRQGVGARVTTMSGPWGAQAVFAANDSVNLDPSQFRPQWLEGASALHLNAHHFYEPRTVAWFDRAVAAAHQLGVQTTLDVSAANRLQAYGREAFWAKVAEVRPTLVFANADEWSLLAGGRPASRLGTTLAIVHRGSRPTRIIGSGGEIAQVPVRRVAAPRRLVGAGDAFAGGMLAALVQGAPDIPTAVDAGHEAAAAWISSPGITPDGVGLGISAAPLGVNQIGA